MDTAEQRDTTPARRIRRLQGFGHEPRIRRSAGLGEEDPLAVCTPSYTGKVDGAGRIVIPVELREKLGVRPGATVTITAGPSGRIVVEPRLSLIKEAQQYFRGLAPENEIWSEELISERRREARREAED